MYAVANTSTTGPEVSSSSTGDVRCGSGYQNTPEEYVLNTTLPSVPDKLMVYKTAEPKVSKADVASLAERMGLNGSIKEVSDGFLVTDGQYCLKINTISGSVLYTETSKVECEIQNIRFSGYSGGSITCDVSWDDESHRDGKDSPPGLPSMMSFEFGRCFYPTSALPSNDEAIEIAKEFLNDTGLMPEDAVLRGVEHSALKSVNNRGETLAIGGMNVWFSREINGLPITGGGSEIGVGVCSYQDIAGVFKVWREYEPYREYSIITPEEALKEFEREGVDVCVGNVRMVVTINNVYLGYYAKPAGEEQTYLQPVYVFEGVTKGDCGTLEFVQYIPAVPQLGGIEDSKVKVCLSSCEE